MLNKSLSQFLILLFACNLSLEVLAETEKLVTVSPKNDWRLITDNNMTREKYPTTSLQGAPVAYKPGTVLLKPNLVPGKIIPAKSEKMVLSGTLIAEDAGSVICTAGADYWFSVAVNGKEVYHSYPHGNSGGVTAESMVFLLPVRKGENKFAIFAESGSRGCSAGVDFHSPTRENMLRLSLTQSKEPVGILYEPWASDPECRQITLRCVTFGPAVAMLSWRKAGVGAEWNNVAEMENGYFVSDRPNHAITLKNLEPDTLYEYQIRIFSDGKEYPGSSVKHFRTLPEKTDKPIRFLLFSDTHVAGAAKYKLLEHFLTHQKTSGAAFLAHLGDLSGSYKNFSYEILFSLTRFFSEREISLLAIQGNHECQGAEAAHFNRYFRYENEHPSWKLFQIGNSAILCLSLYTQGSKAVLGKTDLLQIPTVFQKEKEAIRKALNSELWQNAEFRIVLTHEPIYKKDTPDSFFGGDGLYTLFEDKKLPDIWFCGHTHPYKIVRPGTQPSPKENKKLQAIIPRPFPIVTLGGGEKTEEFTLVEVTLYKNMLQLKTTDSKGEVLDILELKNK